MMSRRSRRKRGGSKSPWLGKAVIVLGVLLLLAIGAAYLGLRSYLHSDGFRKFLSAQVSKAANVDGSFAAFNWDGMAVRTERFDATGKGLVRDILAERIGTEIGFGGVGRGVWEVKSTQISRLQVSLNLVPGEQAAVVSAPVLPEKPVKKKQSGWIPKKVELESLEIGDLGLQLITSKGLATAKGMRVLVEPAAGQNAYDAEITGGKISNPISSVPELQIKNMEASYRDNSLFVKKAELSVLEEGRIELAGESNLSLKTHAYDGTLSGVRCDELLSEDWAKRLTGDVSTTFKVNKTTGSQVVSGDLKISNGTLTALPMLDALAAYADTRRFRILQLSESRMKWRITNGEVLLTDIVLESEGLIRLEGRISIKGEAIDGSFQLGLVPGTLANIPGAETDVFQPGRYGYLWAPIRVTGTLSEPEEDLTARLTEAAGARMFEMLPETGERVFKFTRNALGETPSQIIKQGTDVIDKGEDVIKGAEGVLKGLLGN